jgi:hypothetical protein
LLTNASEVKIPPYDLTAAYTALKELVAEESEVIFNLTGGTKLMMLAAFVLASRSESPFVYFQSQDRQSLLLRYEYEGGLPVLVAKEAIPPVITAGEYLKAHLPGFREEGCSIGDGGRFEAAISNALKEHGLEVLVGVRPEGVDNQIEIDLVVRCGNQVGIAEVKQRAMAGRGPKAALDQLTMAAGREYLGTYTARFLITGDRVTDAIRTLAQKRDITIIELSDYRGNGSLSLQDTERLVQQVYEKLATTGWGI